MGKKPLHAITLSDATDACVESAARLRRPAKVMAELMGVELKTYYRWLSDNSMPLRLLKQFEEFCGARHISEHLCVSSGSRIVIDIPTGRRPSVADLAQLQRAFADAAAALCRYYESGDERDAVIASLTSAMTQAAYHRANVAKDCAPELPFNDGGASA